METGVTTSWTLTLKIDFPCEQIGGELELTGSPATARSANAASSPPPFFAETLQRVEVGGPTDVFHMIVKMSSLRARR
jgi:hypothetical protein